MIGQLDVAYIRSFQGRSWEDIRRGFRWQVPATLNIGVETCDRWADGERQAMLWIGADGRERRYRFEDLRRLSNRFANVLRGLGVQRGDRVFMLLPRVPEHHVALLGALKAGAVVSSLTVTFGREAIRYRLQDAGVRVLVTDTANLEKCSDLGVDTLEHIVVVGGKGPEGFDDLLVRASDRFTPEPTRSDDNAYIFYTSGTTGSPKGSLHSHALLPGWAALVAIGEDLRDDDVFWPTSDLAWVTGQLLTFGSWALGHPILVYQGELDPERWFDLFERYGVTNTFAAPTAFRMLRKAEHLLDRHHLRLRRAGTVGEPLDADTFLWGRERLGITIYEVYGQTEHGAGATANLDTMPVRPGSMGRSLPYLHCTVVDGEGRELPPGEVGEVATRPDYPSLFKGYWNRPDATNEKFAHGWHLTGDLARVDEDGYFWFQGRKDDLINASGYRIGPTEIEAAIMSVPGVIECAAVGKPDPVRGEIVKAFVTLAPGVPAGEEMVQRIQEAVRRTVGGYAYPREVEFLDELPKTATGKIRRAELRQRCAPPRPES
ncbi:MAG: AMP-binding protein [Clostridia bacterium]|nr:AMP-binding protein [Clostridia bacterium]